MLNGFSNHEIDNLRYGQIRYTELLELIYNQHPEQFEQIDNLLEWSHNIYINKNGAISPTNKINIGKTILMTLDDASTNEQSIAGYILTFIQIIHKSSKLIAKGISATELRKILDKCYNHACNKSFWSCYQIELYFHNLSYMHGGYNGMPSTKMNSIEP